jgi:predicted DNA-binding transcriptional regulator YafY
LSRSQRLLDLLQILRRHRYPVTGATLAEELGISLRTLYRDIATLQEQGAHIEGESGLGYVLKPGFTLPPLMFTEDEIEALVLGSRWVAERADARFAAIARDALAKIAAVLPDELRNTLDASTLFIGPGRPIMRSDLNLPVIRRAIRNERKLDITYLDLKGIESRRVIWPFALGYFDQVDLIMAWCELRKGFRSFRADRIAMIDYSEQRYPRRRAALLKEWRERQEIESQAQAIPEAIAADRN